jgi:hypothetical protein
MSNQIIDEYNWLVEHPDQAAQEVMDLRIEVADLEDRLNEWQAEECK